MEEVFAVVAMFLLRLGLPLALTLAVGFWLRRLDAKWESETAERAAQDDRPDEVRNLKVADPPCWEVHGCSEASRANCPACKAWDLPCWAAWLKATGRLPPMCGTCELFALESVEAVAAGD